MPESARTFRSSTPTVEEWQAWWIATRAEHERMKAERAALADETTAVIAAIYFSEPRCADWALVD